MPHSSTTVSTTVSTTAAVAAVVAVAVMVVEGVWHTQPHNMQERSHEAVLLAEPSVDPSFAVLCVANYWVRNAGEVTPKLMTTWGRRQLTASTASTSTASTTTTNSTTSSTAIITIASTSTTTSGGGGGGWWWQGPCNRGAQ